MRDWIVMGKGIGVRFEGTYLRWIYWVPGTQAQEGLLVWGKETHGVVPWRKGGPRHMHRSDNEILADLLETTLPDEIVTEAQRRQPTAQQKQIAHFGKPFE